MLSPRGEEGAATAMLSSRFFGVCLRVVAVAAAGGDGEGGGVLVD